MNLMAESKEKARYDDTDKNLYSKHKNLTQEKLLSSNYYLSITNKNELRNHWNFAEREEIIRKQLGF